MAAIGGGIIGALLRHTLGRWTRRSRASRELKQIRSGINDCAAIFVGSTQGGTVPQLRLPTDPAAYLPSLHSDGLLSDEGFEIIRTFFALAEHTNLWLTAPPQQGPPGFNAAQHWASLLDGRRCVEEPDSNGMTLRDRALAEVSAALTALNRQWWKPW